MRSRDGLTQADMIHRLPPARIVDRAAYLTEAVTGRRAIHVGFVDSGCVEHRARTGTWLHTRLHDAAASLVGLDVDSHGVELAREAGFEGYAVDCADPDAVKALGLHAEVVVAGEVIEHIERGGDLLDALHHLVEPEGRLILTTPNASGLLNASASALAGMEVNHPDHVVLYSCQTLVNLLQRHAWVVDEVATYLPEVHTTSGMPLKTKMLATAARGLLVAEALLGRLGRPFAADGMIVSARRLSPS